MSERFKILFKRFHLKYPVRLLAAGLTFILTLTGVGLQISCAVVRYVDVHLDLENISGWTPGVAFFPEIVLDDDVGYSLDYDPHLWVDTSEIYNATNPTIGLTVRFSLDSHYDIFDDDLEMRGAGIRAGFVDLSDGSSASGRFLIYPFYQLMAPGNLHVDFDTGIISWDEVDYAGDYEVVMTYVTDSGNERTAHFKSSDTSLDIVSYIRSGMGGIGVAVRALATEEMGYLRADVDESAGTATWEPISGVQAYKVKVSYANGSGETVTKTRTVIDNSINIYSYKASAQPGTLRVSVYGIPTANEARYYNIAPSEWSLAAENTASPDTSDYDVDYVWDFMADYYMVTAANFSVVSDPAGAYANNDSNEGGSSSQSPESEDAPTGSSALATSSGWVRNGYRWQYLEMGAAFNAGWKYIGGDWYYFGTDGYMQTGWLFEGEKWYYLTSVMGDDNGKMMTGTQSINGKTYIFDTSGVCLNR